MSRESSDLEAPILWTKLHRPQLPRDAVTRRRPLERMAGASDTPVTLVAGPAGSGKSVLVAQWVGRCGYDSAWVSLGESESDLRLFLIYLLSAVEGVRPESCDETRSLVYASDLPPLPLLARSLANDLERLGAPLVVVLDDYHHVAGASDVHRLVDRLLEHPPPALRLVISTRRDPPLGLYKLRADGRLTEIRLQDLRFTVEETANLLKTSKSLVVSREALEHLHREVEGWAVGLRLALASLQPGADADAFLLGLRGGVPHAQEYLIKEVLAGLPSGTRRLLVLSSIFDRFSAAALDAVLVEEPADGSQQPSGHDFIASLQARNLFVILLDAEGKWLRYHHLFRDLLRRELGRAYPKSEVAALHRQASGWFESQGLIDEALEHAVAAGEPLLAGEIIERHRRAEANFDRWYVIERWMRSVPEEIVERRPELLLARASLFMEHSWYLQVASTTEKIEALVARDGADEAVRGELDFFLGAVEVWHRCNGAAAVRVLESARERLPSDTASLRAKARLYLAAAAVMDGRGRRELARIEQSLDVLDSSSHPMVRSALLTSQSLVNLLLGELHAAARSAERLTAMVTETRSASKEGFAYHLLVTSKLQMLELSEAMWAFSAMRKRRHGVTARLSLDVLAGEIYAHRALSQNEDADALLEELKELAHHHDAPVTAEVAGSCGARLSLSRGELDAAAAWADSRTAPLHARSILHLFEVPALTQARVWVALGDEERLGRALAQLETLSSVVSAAHFLGQKIEVDVLRALALERSNRSQEALEVLGSVVKRSVRRGWLRPFAEAGPLMAELLDRLAEGGSSHDDVHRLQRALKRRVGAVSAPAAGPESTRVDDPRPARVPPQAAEILTNREMDVVELLALRLRDKEIAARLGISPETVKDHLRHLYTKLDVGNRRDAVVRASSMGLLSPRSQ